MTFQTCHAAEWQWGVSVDPNPSTTQPARDYPRAFLWIPSNCQRVRAIVVGQNNMLEEPIFEHPEFRKVLAELGVAEIWITPNFDPVFDPSRGSGDWFWKMI